ncbi:MAG: DUF309 domain-containing protein [Phormidesmis sp.]
MPKPSPSAASPDSLENGIDQFNRSEFYACHDTLEAIWMAAETAEKPFYQGILQVAVGFYHLSNLNWRGGAILLGEGISRLRRFEPRYKGVVVETLVDQAAEWLALIQSAGPEGLAAVMTEMPQAFPQIERC